MRNFTNDITYCTNNKCKDHECFRNKRNMARTDFPYISEADFIDCPKWNEPILDKRIAELEVEDGNDKR